MVLLLKKQNRLLVAATMCAMFLLWFFNSAAFIPACSSQACSSALICGSFYPRPSAQSLPSRQAGASSLPADHSQAGAFYKVSLRTTCVLFFEVVGDCHGASWSLISLKCMEAIIYLPFKQRLAMTETLCPRNQYINPKCQRGMVLRNPVSKSSLTMNPLGASFICLSPLFFPPTSKSIPSIVKSAMDEAVT